MAKILVIGSLNMDTVATVERMPREGETILGGSLELIPGGKGANQAYAAAKLGGDVAMIGMVGGDANGRALTDNLKSVGVDTSGIGVAEAQPTGAAMITVNAHGNNSIVVIPGANRCLTEEIVEERAELIRECDILVMQLEIPISTVLYAAKLAKSSGKTVILDPAPAAPDLPEELFGRVDILKPNETELATLTRAGTDSLEQIESAARTLLERGVGSVVATLGGRGAAVVTRSGLRLMEAEAVKVVDTTAAGDCFTAALACGLSRQMPLHDAVALGNRVSTVVVQRRGAQTSIPSMPEVLEWERRRTER